MKIQNIKLWISVLRENCQLMTGLPVSKLENEREGKGPRHTPFHGHVDAFACYVQIVFVITVAVSSEMSLNLLMCIG